MLGIAKVLGVVALVIPWAPRLLREWAYAGFAIATLSAAVSHAASGDPAARIVMPLVALVLLVISRSLWHPTDGLVSGNQRAIDESTVHAYVA